MKLGRAFEILVKNILISVGFSEVASDGLYIFDGAPGQMIQGLGEAHNADVLLEPPVQTPFYSQTRLLVECKDYSQKVGLNAVRGALGMREDINHFEIVDLKELVERRKQNRKGVTYNFERYSYQVALAAMNGYTTQAQKFAATHRISLIEFYKMPFWGSFCKLIGYKMSDPNSFEQDTERYETEEMEMRIRDLAERIGERMAVAVTASGQMLFLYRISEGKTDFYDEYFLHWSDPSQPWELQTGEHTYLFQLPDNILKLWLESSANDIKKRRETALDYKMQLLSNMVVYYRKNHCPAIKMISIDQYALDEARKRLRR